MLTLVEKEDSQDLLTASPQAILVATANFLQKLPPELRDDFSEIVAANARIAASSARRHHVLHSR